jgi:2-keto-4-pentenoate hydratase/2-oxohepta-3-ene-1,7-dioic acid hydratase in catechol pathway
MRLVTYSHDGGSRSGVLLDALVVDTEAAAAAAGLTDPLRSNRAVLAAGPDAWRLLAGAAAHAEGLPLDGLRLGPPIEDPDKIICLGLNYRDHAAESAMAVPSAPTLFAKFRNSLVGPADAIRLPAASEAVDYEAELAAVIGRRCKDVDESDALSYVAGVMAFNDVSARDLQHQTSQWTAGKALDTFAPCGPALVFLDEVDDVQQLGVRARVNGVTVQDGTTADMVFSVAETIAFLSRLMTLEPGDIVSTGTPAGVGFSRDPKLLLQSGDLVEVEIDGVGTLANRVEAAS